MSLPIITLVSGVAGVFIVMFFLQLMVNVGSRMAVSLEKKPEKQPS